MEFTVDAEKGGRIFPVKICMETNDPLKIEGNKSTATFAGFLQALRWIWEPWLAPWIGKKSDSHYGRGPLLTVSLLAATFLFGFIPLKVSFVVWLFILIGVQITATLLTTLTDAVASDEKA